MLLLLLLYNLQPESSSIIEKINPLTMQGICHLSMLPVRSEPSHRSELTNQLLAGESYSVLNEMQEWLLIKGHLDAYEGWIDIRQFCESDTMTPQDTQPKVLDCSLPFAEATAIEGSERILLPRGCNLPFFDNGNFKLGSKAYKLNIDLPWSEPSPEGNRFNFFCALYLNAPYLWGGRSPVGIDCSGFTQMVYKLIGKSLPRDASQQAAIGETINFVSEARPGDLAFFDNAAGAIVHTGMLLGDGTIIHSSGFVRIDPVDHHGIFNASERKYSHSLRLIKRIV